MNRKNGIFRLTQVLSVVFIVFGIMIATSGGDEDFALTIGILGPVLVWILYGGFWYVLKGFQSQNCENCEKTIEKLEDRFEFKTHVVCAKCHEKLNRNQKEIVS